MFSAPNALAYLDDEPTDGPSKLKFTNARHNTLVAYVFQLQELPHERVPEIKHYAPTHRLNAILDYRPAKYASLTLDH